MQLIDPCQDDPMVIEVDGRTDASSFRHQCAEIMTALAAGWWKGSLTIVLRDLSFVDAIPIDSLAFLSRYATDCEVCLVNCHPNVVRLFESAPYRGCFNLITTSTPFPSKLE